MFVRIFGDDPELVAAQVHGQVGYIFHNFGLSVLQPNWSSTFSPVAQRRASLQSDLETARGRTFSQIWIRSIPASRRLLNHFCQAGRVGGLKKRVTKAERGSADFH